MSFKRIMALAGILGLVGCASNDSHIRDFLQKNPDVVMKVIEDNPEKFLETVNRAAQKVQQMQYEKRMAEIKKQEQKDLQTPRKPQLDPGRELSGHPEGKIILVEYGDFQCPACGVGYGALKKFKEKYKDQVQFYFKNMPLDFHPMALPSARYFEAMRLQGREKADRFLDYVYENQNSLKNEMFLQQAAKKSGADLAKLKKDLSSPQIERNLQADKNEFEQFGFTGTPVIVLNGVAMDGAQSLAELERVMKMTEH